MKILRSIAVFLLLALSTWAQTGDVFVQVQGGRSVHTKSEDLARLPRREIKAMDHDGIEATYSGIELREILIPAGAKMGKDLHGAAVGQYLIIDAVDGYHAVYSITELDPDHTDKVVILADRRDGKPLDAKNGPWQVIATGEKKHARWVRQVTGLRVQNAGSEKPVTAGNTAMAAEQDLIREVVFRKVLSHWVVGEPTRPRRFYLAVDDVKDPSKDLLDRLGDLKVPLHKVSECYISAREGDIVKDKKTGKQGDKFSVSKLTWVSDTEVTAVAGSYSGNMGSDSCRYTLRKENGIWAIVGSAECQIS